MNPTTSYGLGWLISTRSWANGKILFHDGSNGGNHSLIFVVPSLNAAFLATTNAYDPDQRSYQALDALIQRLVTSSPPQKATAWSMITIFW